jgi:RNA polymerase subunit RPABC4/transcription elongation factor Spt4
MYCKRCGARLQQGIYICPECGARQRAGASTARCANCHGRVPIDLRVCPHCGRDLLAAGPRWELWLAGAAVVALLGMWALGRLPVREVRDVVVDARNNVEGLVQILGAVSLTPDPDDLVAALDSEPTDSSVNLLPSPTPTHTATPMAAEIVVSEAICRRRR